MWHQYLQSYICQGYYDRAREGEWSWVDCGADTEFAYSNWAPGQPNDLNGLQDCGQVTNFGEYNDWECTRTMMYICEIWPKSKSKKFPFLINVWGLCCQESLSSFKFLSTASFEQLGSFCYKIQLILIGLYL